MLIAYGFIAASIPVWLLLAPRDYLSTFLKIESHAPSSATAACWPSPSSP